MIHIVKLVPLLISASLTRPMALRLITRGVSSSAFDESIQNAGKKGQSGNVFFKDLKYNYPILEKMNYVSKDLHMGWNHEDFPDAKMFCCTNYEKCVKANRLDNPEPIVLFYFSPRAKEGIESRWDPQRILDLSMALDKWRPFEYVSPQVKQWCIDIASRIISGLPCIPFEQDLLACKWFLTTFLTDDPLEKVMKREEWWPAGKEFIERFSSIYADKDQTGTNTPVTMDDTPVTMNDTPVTMYDTPVTMNDTPVTMDDTLVTMYDVEGKVPKEIIRSMNAALAVHQFDLEPQIRAMFPPSTREACREWAREYAINISEEAKQFGPALRSQKYINVYGLNDTRIFTIGYFWITPPLVPLKDVDQFFNVITSTDPKSILFAWICCADNDIISGPKDQKAEGRDFSPVSRCMYIMQEQGVDYKTALRMVLNERNAAMYKLEQEIWSMDYASRRPYYIQFLLIHKLLDFHFVASINKPNLRYGWYPTVCDPTSD